MSEKHYNADYLADTAKILGGIKMNSYRFFENIASGQIADIGCGTGPDVIRLADLFGERIKVVGVDHDENLIAQARKALPEGANAEFVISEVTNMPFAENTFEGLRAERLVQHLPQPETMFREANRVMKSGAPFVVVESDWSSLCFYDAATKQTDRLVQYLTEEKINNGRAAQNLTKYLRDAGFQEVSLQVFPFVLYSVKEAYTYLWIDKMIAEMREKNIYSEDEMRLLKTNLETADENRYFACSMNIAVAVGKKP